MGRSGDHNDFHFSFTTIFYSSFLWIPVHLSENLPLVHEFPSSCILKIMHAQTDASYELEVKKSRFIAYVHPSQDEEEAKEFIRMVRKMHPDATHVCTALRIGDLERSNDDGEPSGTAGHPMLSVLQNRNIDGLAAAVVRYFGGTLLGTGGLVRAYSGALSGCLDQMTFYESKEVPTWILKVPAHLIGKAENWIYSGTAQLLEVSYDDGATYHFLLEEDPTDELGSIFQNGHVLEKGEVRLVDIEIREEL